MKRTSILLAWVLALAGCGDAPAPVLTVEIVSARADPALPREGWRLRGEDGREHPLAPTGARGERGAIYAAQAPAGRYALAGTSPWAPMSGPTFVALAPGAPALQIAAGIERTLYLAAPPGRRIEDATLWALGVGGPDRELDVELAPGTDDWLVVRFRSPADMKGTIRVAARLDDGTFTEPGRLALPGDGTPWGGALRAGSTLPLDVLVMGTVPSDARLHATAIDDGLESPLEAPVGEGGVVRFERFPAARSGARFELRATGSPPGPAWSMGVEDLRRGDLRLWAFPPTSGKTHAPLITVLVWADGLPEDQHDGHLQVRGEGDASYGCVELTVLSRLPDGIRVLWTGPKTASLGYVVQPRGDHSFEIRTGPVCRVRTTLDRPLPTGRRYAVLARRIEDGVAVLGHGFVARELAGLDHDMVLPPGRYRFVAEVAGREGPAVELDLDAPGSRANVRLVAPR